MVDNVFIQCDYCKAKIRMRFQMGYFDIPFDFPCPECGVHIHGLRRITEEHSLKLNNAAVVEFDLNEPHYYADFSVELPHAKTTKFESIEKIVTKGFSPFLMSSNLYKEDDYIHLIADMQRFLSFRDFFQLKLAPLYDLFFNGRISLTPEHFLKISPRFEVKNELDAMMALHQSTILGMSAILHDNALSEFAEITKKITERKTLLKVNRFIVALGGHEYFSSASKRLISIYLRWMKDFEKYIPATMLSLGGVADKLNRDSFGIATTSFEDMKAFYADSYELILDFVDVAIGLNNIAVRGDYNLFPTDSVKGRKKKQVGTFEEYRELIKSAKLDFLMDNEPFSKAIILNRNVRNAIAHFNYDFDSDSQRIIFSDKHKGRENAVELYLIDLAILCYENISADMIIKNGGLMAKAFPIQNIGQITETVIGGDIVDVSDNFAFAFETAGYMCKGRIYTAKVTEQEEEPITLGKILQTTVDDKFYITNEKMPKWTYLKGAKKIPRKSADGHEYTFSEGPIAFPDPWDRPGRTMLTSESTINRSTHVVSDPGTGRLRLLTPVEAERLQGFDDEWTNTGMPDRMRYFCMGNALVVPMITRMGRVLDTIIAEEK